MFPLFVKGYKKDLQEEDLYPHLDSHESTYLGNKLQREWIKEIKKRPKNPSLWKSLVRVFGKQLMFLGILNLFMELFIR